jgi:starvation-inducible DNA-binding protein
MESDCSVHIFWSSAHPWEQLGRRFLPGSGEGASACETLRLFSTDHETEIRRLLNDALADSITLQSLYNTLYWRTRGDSHSELEQLLRQHAREQIEFIDHLAQLVHTLGGVAISDPRHVAEVTTVPLMPNGYEGSSVMLYRILEAHRIIIEKIHRVMTSATEERRDVANERLMGDMLSRNEHQAWLVAEQLVGVLTTA